jgi:arylsulfatase A-like enzyme
VPYIVRWPGIVTPGSRSDYRGQTFDSFATFLAAAEGKPPEGIDAVSLQSLLRGGQMPSAVRELYFVRREGGAQYGGKSYEALIPAEWKLLQNTPYSPFEL